MDQAQTPMAEFLQTSMAKIKEMVDVYTIVGDPVTTPDGVTLVPVSRVSFGFGGGGWRRAEPKLFRSYSCTASSMKSTHSGAAKVEESTIQGAFLSLTIAPCIWFFSSPALPLSRPTQVAVEIPVV